MARSQRQTPRTPATKFAHLRKKMQSAKLLPRKIARTRKRSGPKG